MPKSYFDSFIEKVKKGKEGNMIWIPSPYKRWKNKLGLSKKFYTLVGGDSGSGKSAFIDRTYILHTVFWYLRNKEELSFKPKIILRSMERSKEYRIAKWVCYLMYEKFNILADFKTVFGMHVGDSRLSSEVMEKIKKCRSIIELLEKYITIIDGQSTPTGVFKDFRHYALMNGNLFKHKGSGQLKIAKYIRQKRKIEWKNISKSKFPDNKKMPERYEMKYIPDDEEEIVIPVVDHIQKYKNRKGWGDKQSLDKATEYSSVLRDLYGMSPINVSQFNRNKSDTRRRFNQNSEFKPEENDFKGSGDMYEDSDICIALFNPREYRINRHLGYSVEPFTNDEGYNRFRSAFVLKNTYGPDNFGAGFHFIGEIGKYSLLPKAKNLEGGYSKYANVEKSNNVIDIVKR